MSAKAITFGIVAVAAIVGAWHSSGDKAFGFWLLAVFALMGLGAT